MELADADATLLAIDAIEPYRTLAQDNGLTLTVSIPVALPKVLADPTRIAHVFGNLLSNAIKYTSPGGIVQVSAWTEKDAVWYCVSDTGSGIAAEYLPLVFDQFFRTPEQGANSGAGLGLAIAREIVVAHGGEICAESQTGKGTRFLFSLKVAA
jgi:signal transduction histidine kinase